MITIIIITVHRTSDCYYSSYIITVHKTSDYQKLLHVSAVSNSGFQFLSFSDFCRIIQSCVFSRHLLRL